MAKDWLDKTKDWAHIIATIAVPVVIGVLGYQIQAVIKDREIKRDYVQLATGILSAKDSKPALRQWAVALLGEHSPVPLSNEVKIALRNGDSMLSIGRSTDLALSRLASQLYRNEVRTAFEEMTKEGRENSEANLNKE